MFIFVALTQSVVIWFTWIVNLISDSDVCWHLLALIVGVNPISLYWLILNSYISAGYDNYCAVMDYAAVYLILVDCIAGNC